MTTIIHKKLSYEVKGVLLHVYNTLGPMLPERFYQDAIAIGLRAKGICCETEKQFEVYYRDARVGLYFVDVWVENGKLLLELKVASQILPVHKAQALSYLKVTDADLAIVVNYGESSLTDERLPNFLRDRKATFTWEKLSLVDGWLYPDLTNQSFEALHRVHFDLGPGFLPQVYRRATMIELAHQAIPYTYLKQIPVTYQGHLLGEKATRLINVDDKVLLAIVAAKHNDPRMQAQLRARLRSLRMKIGLLANFGQTALKVIPVRV
jgi:GxxExxY protein